MSILHESHSGKINTYIIRGKIEEIEAKIAGISPLFYDMLPLTLEEIFIYELGGAEYAVKDIIL